MVWPHSFVEPVKFGLRPLERFLHVGRSRTQRPYFFRKLTQGSELLRARSCRALEELFKDREQIPLVGNQFLHDVLKIQQMPFTPTARMVGMPTLRVGSV
jgi:hypothetical protein